MLMMTIAHGTLVVIPFNAVHMMTMTSMRIRCAAVVEVDLLILVTHAMTQTGTWEMRLAMDVNGITLTHLVVATTILTISLRMTCVVYAEVDHYKLHLRQFAWTQTEIFQTQPEIPALGT